MSGEPEILFDLRDGVAEVTLNRPQALNALTLDMVRVFDPQLAAWETDDSVRAVVVRGAGDKAFCVAAISKSSMTVDLEARSRKTSSARSTDLTDVFTIIQSRISRSWMGLPWAAASGFPFMRGRG